MLELLLELRDVFFHGADRLAMLCGCHAAPRLRRRRRQSGVADETVAAAGMLTIQDAAPPASPLRHGLSQ